MRSKAEKKQAQGRVLENADTQGSGPAMGRELAREAGGRPKGSQERTVFQEGWNDQLCQMLLREERYGCTSEKLYVNLAELFWWSVGTDGEARRTNGDSMCRQVFKKIGVECSGQRRWVQGIYLFV